MLSFVKAPFDAGIAARRCITRRQVFGALVLSSCAVALAACSQAQPTAPPKAPSGSPPQPTSAPPPTAPPSAAVQSSPPATTKPAAKPSPVSVSFGYPAVAATYWHLFIAQEKGLYADEGVDFKPTYVPSTPSIAQGVVASAYALGSITADVGVAAIQNGADLVYVASEIHTPMFSIVTQPEIKSFADIKNNMVAGAATVRGGTATVLRLVLTMKGLKEGVDYSIVAAGSTAERVGALRNKTIGFALMAQPQDFMMQDEGFPILAMTSDFIKDYGNNEIAVKRDWAKANEDALIRFIRAHSRTIDWLYDPKNKDEAIQILAKTTKIDEKYARKTYESMIEKVKAFVPKGEPSEQAIDGTIKAMIAAGDLQSTPVSGATAVDKSYWRKAQDSLKNR